MDIIINFKNNFLYIIEINKIKLNIKYNFYLLEIFTII